MCDTLFFWVTIPTLIICKNGFNKALIRVLHQWRDETPFFPNTDTSSFEVANDSYAEKLSHRLLLNIPQVLNNCDNPSKLYKYCCEGVVPAQLQGRSGAVSSRRSAMRQVRPQVVAIGLMTVSVSFHSEGRDEQRRLSLCVQLTKKWKPMSTTIVCWVFVQI